MVLYCNVQITDTVAAESMACNALLDVGTVGVSAAQIHLH